MKTKVKFLIVFAIILFAIFIIGTNTVQANSLADLPDVIEVNLSSKQAIKNGFISDELKNAIKDNIDDINLKNNIKIGFSELRQLGGYYDITKIVLGQQIDDKNLIVPEKTITVKYNDNGWNESDKQYVLNNIKNKDLRLNVEVTENSDSSEKYFAQEFKSLINDSNIKSDFKILSGEWGAEYNYWYDGTVSLEKNNVVYYGIYTDVTGRFIFDIPEEVEETEEAYIEYALPIIKNKLQGASYTEITMKKGTIKDEFIIVLKYNEFKNETPVLLKKIVKNVLKEDTTTNIQLEADTTIIPENTELVTEKIKNYVNTMLINTNEFYAYDITLKSNGVKVQPNGKVKIRIPIPKGMETSNLVVYRVEENELIKYDVTIEEVDGVKFAVFETDHFSTYILADNSTKESQEENDVTKEETKTGEKDETPKTGTNIIEYIWKIIKEII